MRLRHCAKFQRQAQVPDGYGNTVGGWADHLTVWSNVLETTGKERVAAGSIEGVITATIRVRDRGEAKGLTAADRVYARSKFWRMETPTHVGSDGKYLDIKCIFIEGDDGNAA